MMNIRRFLFPLILIIIAGCTSDRPSKPEETITYNFNIHNYDIVTNLTWSQRWYVWSANLDYVNGFPHDQHNIVMALYGGQYYYNPFLIAQHGLLYLNSYRDTNDPRYLDRTFAYAEKLAEIGYRAHSGIYVPYTIDYVLHNGSTNDVMVAPWYSGFTQSYVLSLYSRIYELTGNSRMKALADSVFNTFLYTDSSSNAWMAFVDSAEYYWIEEYPFHPPTHVFNGFMVGIQGLHDYYMISRDERCLYLFRGACTTIAHYAHEWRVPGGVSYYCLKHKIPLSDYHLLVISLLRQITIFTGDPYFNAFADTLYSDYH